MYIRIFHISVGIVVVVIIVVVLFCVFGGGLVFLHKNNKDGAIPTRRNNRTSTDTNASDFSYTN